MRILVTGASGSGTSTLGQAVAREIGAKFIEADDHFWFPSDPPYQRRRPPAERLDSLLEALRGCSPAVVSGSVVDWGLELEDSFSLVVFLSVPIEVRLARLRRRELERFGKIDEGFLEWAAQYEEGRLPGRSRAIHEKWLSRRSCPKMRIEGEVTVERAVSQLVAALSGVDVPPP